MDTVADFLNLYIDKINKKLLKDISFFLILLLRTMLNQTKYIAKILLIFIFRLIKKKMPRIVMNWVKAILFAHPNIYVFLKKLRLHIIDIKNPNKGNYIKHLLYWLTKIICIPFLELIFRKNTWRLIFFNQLKGKKNLLINFYTLFVEMPKMFTDNKSSILEYNSQLSSSAQMIYGDLIKKIAQFKQTN